MTEQAETEPSGVSNPRLAVQAVLRTDVGLVRSENQDFGTFTSPQEERESNPGGRLLIVADGMGGHRGGATASRLATETVKAQYLDSETVDVGAALRDALTRANARIFSEAQGNPDLRGMGTTASALVLKNHQAWFGHVGDSRIYRVRSGAIEQLTEDHSLVASMVREGLLTAKEAETHPRRNVLQRSMGVAEELEVDVRGPFDVVEGDLFILCSDGLHGLVKEGELQEIAALPIRKAADEYVRRALERGAPDNVTVIVAKAIRADELGDETLTDLPANPFEEGKLEETHRVPPPPPPADRPKTLPSPQASGAQPVPATHDKGGPDGPTEQQAVIVGGQPPGAAATPTPPLPAPPDPSGSEAKRSSAPVATIPDRPVIPAATPGNTQKTPARGWTWILIAILAGAGAVGAWMYWSHQQHRPSKPPSIPRAR